MTDTISSEQRSRNMSRIKSKNTKPEVYLRKLLFSKGFRYRLHSKKITGKPDIWLKKYNTAIFVHGCFWHQHKDCKYAYHPKSRVEFWNSKFQKNQSRDLQVHDELMKNKIKQLIVWECTIKKMKKDSGLENEILNKIVDFLNSDLNFLEL